MESVDGMSVEDGFKLLVETVSEARKDPSWDSYSDEEIASEAFAAVWDNHDGAYWREVREMFEDHLGFSVQ